MVDQTPPRGISFAAKPRLLILIAALALSAVFLAGVFSASPVRHLLDRGLSGTDAVKAQAARAAAHQSTAIRRLAAAGLYRCCTKNPCTYCFSDTRHYTGKGAACACIDDLMNSNPPCPECIGVILRGGGNPLIAEYFAAALSRALGGEYYPLLVRLMEERYGIAPEAQL